MLTIIIIILYQTVMWTGSKPFGTLFVFTTKQQLVCLSLSVTILINELRFHLIKKSVSGPVSGTVYYPNRTITTILNSN